MSYHPHRSRYGGRQGLGSVASTVSAATAIVTDPYLPEVTKLVLRLRELEAKAPTTGTKPSAPTPGIGLRLAVKPLRAFVYLRERPWVLPVGAVAVVGGLVGLGYLLGRHR
jgi:hypothetical protein